MGPRNTPDLPGEREGEMIPLTIDKVALLETYDTTIDTAQDITLEVATSLIEVNAIGQGIFLKYATGVTSSDFDEYIQEGQTRHYVKPNGVTAISYIGIAVGGAAVIIQK
jgi:hypothetical protein